MFLLSPVTVPEVFAKVNSAQFSSRSWNGKWRVHANIMQYTKLQDEYIMVALDLSVIEMVKVKSWQQFQISVMLKKKSQC